MSESPECQFDTARCENAKCRATGCCIEARRQEIERENIYVHVPETPTDE